MTWPPLNRQPGEIFINAAGRKVEIVAVDGIYIDGTDVSILAYRFLGGTMIHLRSVDSTKDWVQV